MRLSRAAAGMLLLIAAPAIAQTTAQLDLRVSKLEKEMRAVQRKVFPLGEPVQPELTATPSTVVPGAPASSPVADLSARVDSLEKQVTTLTGASEQNGFRIRQLEEALAKVQARLTAIETPPEQTSAAAPAGAPAAALATVTAQLPTAATPQPQTQTQTLPQMISTPPQIARPSAAATPRPAPAKADPARKAAIAAIEMPATGDAAEDDYTYGFRLYTAKLFPEAQVKLKEFVAKYPSHRRASYAQNLLGRAYLDEGKPALASVAFYDNYQKMPAGERASESLYWLGQSLTQLNKLPDACEVYDELRDVYGTRMSAELKARAAKGRTDAKCTA